MNLGISLKETIGDGLLGSFHFSFPACRTSKISITSNPQQAAESIQNPSRIRVSKQASQSIHPPIPLRSINPSHPPSPSRYRRLGHLWRPPRCARGLLGSARRPNPKRRGRGFPSGRCIYGQNKRRPKQEDSQEGDFRGRPRTWSYPFWGFQRVTPFPRGAQRLPIRLK